MANAEIKVINVDCPEKANILELYEVLLCIYKLQRMF